jgi:hypothetical protein
VRPKNLHRHPLLLAGRQDDAGRDHHGQEDRQEALAKAIDYVRAIKKTPIVVNDTRGFYANRCVGTFMQEGHGDAGRRRAAGDDRQCRPQATGMPAVRWS